VTVLVAMVATAVMIGLATGLAGVWLVLRRQAMLADAISHAVLPGLVVGSLALAFAPMLGGFIGAVAAGLATVAGVEWLRHRRQVAADSAIGFVFPVLFALGVVLVSGLVPNVHLDADAVLYGELALAPQTPLIFAGYEWGPEPLWVGALVLLANIAFALKFGAEWRAMTFDPVQPAMDPRRRQVIERVSLFVVASSVVAAFSAVGAVMAVALMVVPAAVMSLASRRWAVVLVGAPLLGAATAGVGTWVSWNPDWSPSGTIILVLAVVFFGALLFTPESGIWAAARRRLRQKGLVQGSALVVHLATHANTEREAYESQWGHLITELGWKPAEARRAVRAAVGQGWIMDGPQLRLTPDGQALAESLTMPARRTIAS